MLAQLYSQCDGVSLPDIHSGYFVHPLQRLGLSHPKSEPTKVTGQFTGDVDVFGSTGNGGLFVLRKGINDVLYLPPGAFYDGLYDGTQSKVKRVATDFPSFLEHFLTDVSAFVNDTPGHKYVV